MYFLRSYKTILRFMERLQTWGEIDIRHENLKGFLKTADN